ncbi:cysteine hydrolase [Bradyrhizobium sp. UFLA03-84]|uniref:cysteine hydrolase family protein n=1 Tax=Bradyrhizobium sp. UFLA03-84 TaxID=418599 RepID=UPI000BAE433C|nr:isochorismatase family cysteine hydrolase [Bradyrhizobium sp. UFLA03-84]PAY06788.1 cysteine hydrolase [Bradyrhizobium sp. UFLA03-84]
MGRLKASPGDRAAHLCIDMQRLFTEGGPWPTPWMPRVAPIIQEIVARAPERTIFTRFIPPVEPRDAAGMWRAYYEKWPKVTRGIMDLDLLRLVPELEGFAPPAHSIDKPVYSAFATGALRTYLVEKHVDTLLVTGAETDVCVLASVLDAVDFGYRVIVVKDGLCSSSDAAHEASLHLYAQRFDIQIELAEAGEVLDTWRP